VDVYLWGLDLARTLAECQAQHEAIWEIELGRRAVQE